MSETVNVGSIEALLKLVDQFTGPMKEVVQKIDSLTDKIDKDFKSVDKATDRLSGSFQNLSASVGRELVGNFTRLFAVSAFVSGGIAAVTNVTKQLIQANLEAEASQKKVEEAVRRYGSTSGVTADQIDEVAQSISRLSGLDDELIADAEALALKYNRITTDIFPRFSQVAVDMAVATGDQLPAAFEKAAKIVNQPLRGLTLLSREGYAVSKSQSEMVKSLVKSNDILGAQNVMLDILESQYEGAAAAARDSMTGAVQALSTAWENFLERVGQDNMGPIRQALESIISLLETATDRVYEFELGWHKIWATIYGNLAEAYDSLSKFTNLLSKAALLLGQVSLSRATSRLSSSYAAEAEVAGESVLKHAGALAMLLFEGEKGHKRAAAGALEQTAAEAKLDDQVKKLTVSIDQSIEEMKRRAINARNLYLAATISLKEYTAEVLRQKVTEAILQEENKLRESGIKLTLEQRNAIASAIITEDQFNKKLKETLRIQEEMLTAVISFTDNIALAGFRKDFESQLNKIHHGMELIQQDAEEMLHALNIKGDTENSLEFELRLSGIEDLEPHLRSIEEDYLAFLSNLGKGSISEGERIFAKMAERFGWTVDEIKSILGSINDASLIRDLKFSGKSTLEIYREERREINRLVSVASKKGIDITEEAQKKINDRTADFWSENLSNWSHALDFLANEFGGFFSYLSQAVQVLQQAQAMQSSMSSIGSAMGMSTGAAGAMGAFGAYLVVAKAMYDEFKRHAESRQMRKYDYGAVFSKDPASDWNTPVEGQALAVSHQIQRTAEAFAESIGGVIRSFADLEIQVRKDGKYFRAIVEGELIGQFESMAEATSAALLAAFTSLETDLRGVSELVRSGLKYITSDIGKVKIDNLEDAGDFLSKLREVSELSWSDGASSTLAQVRNFDSLWSSLGKLQDATPPVIQGFNDLVSAEINSWRAWSDSITGREKSQAELLAEKKADAALFEAQKKLRISELELRKLDLKSQVAYLEGKGKGLNIEGKIREGELKLGKEFLTAEAQLLGAELTLNQQFLQALQAQITAIEALIKSLTELPTIDIDKIKIPKGKGGKGADGDSVKDWISDKRFDLDTAGLDEYKKSVLEKEREYQDKLSELNKKDKVQREQILALRERELELMAEERRQLATSSYNEFVNPADEFMQIRNSAAELIKIINDSPFGDEQRASMIGNIFLEIEERIDRLAQESAVGLFSSMISDMEKFGASESVMSEARKHMSIIEHQLSMQHYRTEIAILRQQNVLSQEVLDSMEASLRELENIDVSGFVEIVERASTSLAKTNALNDAYAAKLKADKEAAEKAQKEAEEAAEKLADTLKEANDLLSKYNDSFEDPLTSRLQEIESDFDIIEQALGITPEIISTYNRAISKAYDEALGGVKRLLGNLTTGPQSALTIEKQFQFAMSEFNRIVNEVMSSDFSELDKLESAGSNYVDLLSKMMGTSTLEFHQQSQSIIETLSAVMRMGNSNTTGASSIQSVDNKILAATIDVSTVVQTRAIRQETLLQEISNKLTELNSNLESLRTSNTNSISYG